MPIDPEILAMNYQFHIQKKKNPTNFGIPSSLIFILIV
jgi:hypothetical protein